MGSKHRPGKDNNNHNTEAGISPAARSFKFPTNVKQIGGVNSGMKIYIEDYAYTYINRLGEENEIMSVFLVGFKTAELGEEIIVISGAICPPVSVPPAGGSIFSENDWKYAKNIIGRYFKGLEVVGWARIQPGYGVYLSASDINGHTLDFTDQHALLFICDTEEKLSCFYQWNKNQDDLIEAAGYFIYYDENRGMNEYSFETESIEAPEADKSGQTSEEPTKASAEHDSAMTKSIDNAKRIAEISRQKRIIRMMTSVSALMFFACVVMGIGLLQSGERISTVETQLKELRSGYNNLVSKLNDAVFPAFAAQNEAPPEQSVAADMEENASAQISYEESDFEDVLTTLDKELGITVVPVQPEPESVQQEAPTEEDVTDKAADEDVPSVAETVPASEPVVHIVQQGDTLSSISNRFYGTTTNVGAIMEANGLTNPDMLSIGKKLIIP